MKKIAIGICIVLMLLIPSVSAFNIVNSKVNIQSNKIGDTELPDLIIEDIDKKPDNPYLYEYFSVIRNIGDGESKGMIMVEVTVIEEWLQFGIIPRTEIHTFRAGSEPHPSLGPGETTTIFIAYSDEFHYKSTLKFSAEVNPDPFIEESDYDNNFYGEVISKPYIAQSQQSNPRSQQSINPLFIRFLEQFPILNRFLTFLIK